MSKRLYDNGKFIIDACDIAQTRGMCKTKFFVMKKEKSELSPRNVNLIDLQNFDCYEDAKLFLAEQL